MLCLFTVTLQLITMVGGVGVEPTHPKGTDLQSAATLQLRRLPIFVEQYAGIEPAPNAWQALILPLN